MVKLGAPDRETCDQVSQIIGALQASIAPSCTWSNRGEGNSVLMALPRVTLLNVRKLKE